MKNNLSLSEFIIFLFFMSLLIPFSCKNSGPEPSNKAQSHENQSLEPVMQPVPYHNIKINDNFWRSKIEQNRKVGIPSVFEAASHSIENFDIAAKKKRGKHKGTAASDSDIYKIIQGAAYALHHHEDQELERFVDSLIESIGAAQQPDGYLFTYWTINDPKKKWEEIDRKHELYCAGHLFEAAAAYYQVTEKRKLLDAAVRLADHIISIFGPDKRLEVPGHEEIELGLIKLFHATNEKRFLDQAIFFIDERGNPERIASRSEPPEVDPYANTPYRWRPPSYKQDHLPVEDQHQAAGHAVRAAYLYAALTDIATLTHSHEYLPALNDIWDDIVDKKIYVTGGVGTRQFHNEGFGDPYQLFNDKAYCETCSAIAMTFWNRRMNWLTGDSKFADLVELILYNAGISGVSLTGDRFFYTNPMESDGNHQRKPWFEPGCCPSNMVRFLPEIGSTLYGYDDNGIYINQFIASETTLPLKNTEVALTQKADYPWKGKIEIQVAPAGSEIFRLNIRIPGWTRGEFIPSCDLYQFLEEPLPKKPEFILKVNGKKISHPEFKRGYITINRKWEKKDMVELEFPMNIRVVTGNPKLEDTQGKITLMRGPVIYCLEEADNPQYFDKTHEYFIHPHGFEAEFKKDLLKGVVIIKGKASLLKSPEEIDITAVPYYSWCNRGTGKMKVWLPAYLK